MNPTRTGKIARLPKVIRDQLNQNLADGQSGPEILDWLNAESRVQDILYEHFDGCPISAKNLSEWRQGGHQDWLREQGTLALASQFIELCGDLADRAGHERLSDHFTAVLATEFIKLAQTMLEDHVDPKERWNNLCEIHRQFSRLRRDDHRAVRTSVHKERWCRQVAAEDEAARKNHDQEERRQHVMRYRLLRSRVLADEAELYGRDDIGQDIAAMSLEEQYNLKFGLLGRKSDLFALSTDPDESIYPWRRPVKKAAPEPDPAPNRSTKTAAAKTPTVPTPPSEAGTPAASPEPPSDETIPLTNDHPPTGSNEESPALENPRSATLPQGISRCRPSNSSHVTCPSSLGPTPTCHPPNPADLP